MLPIGDVEKHRQPFDPGCTVDRKESLSWKDMLELSSSSIGINSQNMPSEVLALNGVSNAPRNGILKYEAGHHSKDEASLETVRTTPSCFYISFHDNPSMFCFGHYKSD